MRAKEETMEEIMENEAVTQPEADSPGAGADEGGQQLDDQSVVTLDEILSEAQDSNAESPEAGGTGEAAETVEPAGDDGPDAVQPEPIRPEESPKVYRTQAEFDAAFSKRMAKERAQLRPLAEIGRAIAEVAGGDLTAEEVRQAVASALADKRAKANNTDFDTEMNNIRVEQRVAQRLAPRQPEPQIEQETAAPESRQTVEMRTQEMLRVMEMLGDEGFTVQALQQNREAMAAWAAGAPPAQVYRQFFLGQQVRDGQQAHDGQQARTERPRRPAPERAANSGWAGRTPSRLTDEQIRRIDEAIAKGQTISVV
jgi:hypothetical protein